MKTLILALFTSWLIIIDQQTKEPMPGVMVENIYTGVQYYSDLNGKVEIDTDCSSDRFRISYISYGDTIVDFPKSVDTVYIR